VVGRRPRREGATTRSVTIRLLAPDQRTVVMTWHFRIRDQLLPLAARRRRAMEQVTLAFDGWRWRSSTRNGGAPAVS
jgi:hypothetical protein